MNILFVNYGDFTTNSLNHIGPFANTLCAAGHTCMVAVPQGKDSFSRIPSPLFIPALYDEVMDAKGRFPSGKTADIIHAWTPREGVRKFILAYQRAVDVPARVIIHLEDNEQFLLESYTGKPIDTLRDDAAVDLDAWLVDALPHPLRHESFLRVADGVTHIIDKLAEFAPAEVPKHLLFPGVDFSLYQPQAADETYRRELGLREGERVLVFTGSNTFANEGEMRDLYVAVALLNQRGTPTRLVRTGFNSPRFLDSLSEDVKRHVLDLGFVEKRRLPQLLALADVLVQPGHVGAFNDYRLPSKLPEFLAMGKPVVLPPSNIAHLMRDGQEGVLLSSGSPEDIATTVEKLFANPALCAELGRNAVAFARAHFDLQKNTQGLFGFYEKVAAQKPPLDWSLARRPATSEVSLLTARIEAAAADLGAEAAPLVADFRLLARLFRQLETTLATGGSKAMEAERDHFRRVAELTQQHVRNLEPQVDLSRNHAAALEKARDEIVNALNLTRQHADNLQKATDHHKLRREQAETLLRVGRQQVTAYENALLGADAEIESLKENIANLKKSLRNSRDETAAEQLAQQNLRATHAYELAVAADKLAQVEAILRSREQKIATMQSSFSWQVTSPFRSLRRLLLDKPPAPVVSPKLLGNIDYPQDFSNISPTLNVRGWSLHRDRTPIKGIRAKLGKETVAAEYGLERLDVLDHFRDHPGAERCGWIVKATVPRRGTHDLVIEVQTATGEWLVAVSRPIKRTANAAPPPPNTYAAWVALYDTLTPEIADKIRAKVAALKQRPLISVILPVYNTPEQWLVAAIESVRNQIYENWELCISDDASKEPQVRKILERYQKKDPKRIKVVFRETNGHICANSNSALALAHGEFIALLDHDDEMRAHALACVAMEINEHPNADLIYSDEDKIDENGHRYDHYFKPDWNPDLFNVQNYISHLGVYRTLLVREVGGFRIGYHGSQDWDLAMRVIERSAPDRIRHIPKILYHWRSVPGSTAMMIGEKGYATSAAEKVITEHFTRTGVNATISPTKGSYWRVHYPIPDPAPRITLVIPTRNRLNVLKPCVDSLLEKTTYPNFEILIVDNDSDEPETLDYFKELIDGNDPKNWSKPRAQVRVVHFPGEFNFSAINNYGVRQTDAPLVGLLNNDLEVIHGDWLHEMVSHALRPEIGCVGAKLYYPDDKIQHVGVILGLGSGVGAGGLAGHAWHTHPRGHAGQAHRNFLQQNLSAVTAACLVMRREVYEQVGGFDEKIKVAFNDIDFCLKVRAAGYRNLWTPYAELYHHESASRGHENTLEKRDRFKGEVEYVVEKWGQETLHNDPAYNRNLTLTVSDFSLAQPPRPWAPLDS